MRQASSLDYYHLVKELQVVVSGRIDKIYQEENYFLFVMFTDSGKHNMVFDIPSFIYLTPNKPSFSPPGGFCTFLRKRLQKGKIKSLEQIGFDRIVKLVIEQEQTYHIYLELFNKGNLIVCDEDDKIISLYKNMNFKDRTLRGGVKYELPELQTDITTLSEDEFARYFGERESVYVLATDLGLGGEYSEFILERTGIDKNEFKPDTKLLFVELNNFFSTTNPGYDKKGAYAIQPREMNSTSTLSEAIVAVAEPEIAEKKKTQALSSTKKSKSKYEKAVRMQEEQVVKLAKSSEENQKKGELLYEHYQELSLLMKQAAVDRKNMSEEEFKGKYEAHPLVEKADKQRITIKVE